jgi:hypothetical protein
MWLQALPLLIELAIYRVTKELELRLSSCKLNKAMYHRHSMLELRAGWCMWLLLPLLLSWPYACIVSATTSSCQRLELGLAS